MPRTSKTATFFGFCAIAPMTFLMFAGPSMAFAQMADKLQNAKTISFDSVTSTADGKTVRKSREYFMTPGKSRHEILFPESEASTVAIEDYAAGKSIALISKTKTALVGSIKGAAKLDSTKNMIDYLRSLPQKNSRQLGERQIDGVPVKGIEVVFPEETTTVWAHATTGDPVRIEILHKKAQPGPQTQVVTNIKLDEKLGPEMFSVDPPKGYNVKHNVAIDVNAGPPSSVAGLLKTYAKYMNGEFPSTLGQGGLEPLFEKLRKSGMLKPGQLPDQDDLLQLPANAASVAAVTSKLRAGERWQYYPGVTLAKKDQIAFWYLETKTNTYSAVYGDLRIAKVSKEQLPPGGQP